VVVYVESDLVWDGETLRKLIDLVVPFKVDVTRHESATSEYVDGARPWDVVAPMIFAGEHFYDVYSFRGLDSSRFAPFPPYHSSLRRHGELTEVSCVGSCLVMPATVARDKRVRMESGALVEWCEKARAVGYRLAVVPDLVVRHPA
jgi:hypothetical protein